MVVSDLQVADQTSFGAKEIQHDCSSFLARDRLTSRTHAMSPQPSPERVSVSGYASANTSEQFNGQSTHDGRDTSFSDFDGFSTAEEEPPWEEGADDEDDGYEEDLMHMNAFILTANYTRDAEEGDQQAREALLSCHHNGSRGQCGTIKGYQKRSRVGTHGGQVSKPVSSPMLCAPTRPYQRVKPSLSIYVDHEPSSVPRSELSLARIAARIGWPSRYADDLIRRHMGQKQGNEESLVETAERSCCTCIRRCISKLTSRVGASEEILATRVSQDPHAPIA